MGLIQDLIRKIKDRREEKDSYARGRFIESDFEHRKLSSDERELMRFREEDRKKRIKAELERRRKQENEKVWSGRHGNPINAPNVNVGHKKLFSGGNMFSNCPNCIKQETIIGREKNIFKHGK